MTVLPQIAITALTAGTPKITDVQVDVDVTDTSMASTGTTKKYTRSDLVTYTLQLFGYTTIAPCNYATTANLTATYNNGTLGVGATLTNSGTLAALTIDGAAVATSSLILVKNQTTQAQNGIYVVTVAGTASVAWILTRVSYWDESAEMFNNQPVAVISGTTNGGTIWQSVLTVPVVVGTDVINFIAFDIRNASIINLPVLLSQGGTSAVLAADNGGILYSGASALAILASTATAGQILRSGSNSAPSWSTATYPATAGAATNILTSDGTNWVSSPSAGAGSPLTTKGDIYTFTTVNARLGVGSNNQVLIANSAQATGLQWITPIWLPLAGGTMSGAIDMGSNKITSLGTPTVSTDAATKAYADLMLPLAGGTMSGNISMGGVARVTNALDPVSAQDYATKFYVDQTTLNGTSVYAATTATLNATQSGAGVGATLTDASGTFAAFTTDGTSPSVGDNILNKNQTNAAHQGIYTLTTNGDGISVPWVLTRAIGFDTTTEINNTGLIVVRNGTLNAGTTWYNTATIVTVDTTNFNFVMFGASTATGFEASLMLMGG